MDVGNTPNILLVEDNAADASLVRLSIEQAGLRANLRILADGDAAVDYLRRMSRTREPLCPDLLILDLNLPAASSEEILAVLRRHRSGAKTRVILITGMLNPEQGISKFRDCRLFTKPVHLEEFLKLGDVIREVLEEARVAIPSVR
jgi:chemotaxis family two-component system response regulator Rcp1